MIEMRDNGEEAKKITEAADNAQYRSIYLPLLRGVTPKALEAFDAVSQTLVSGTRENTTVPTQALFLLNSTFARQQSLALAERVLAEGERFDAEAIQQVYLGLLGRRASDAEITRASQFLADYAASYRVAEPVVNLVAAAVTEVETEAGTATAVPGQAANPDDVDRAPLLAKEAPVEPKTASAAAWMSFIQSLYASAEFRFVR